jgi:hypothetical protein
VDLDFLVCELEVVFGVEREELFKLRALLELHITSFILITIVFEWETSSLHP